MDTVYHQTTAYRNNAVITSLRTTFSYFVRQIMHLTKMTFWGLLLINASLCVISIFGDLFWISDVLHNFALHLLAGFIVLSVTGLLIKQRKLAAMALLFMILQTLHISPQLPELLPFSSQQNCVECSGEEISIFQYNLLFSNPNIPKLVEVMLSRLEHDVLVFQEVTGAHQETLAPLEFAYPFVYQQKDIRVFSRLPLEKVSYSKHNAFLELIGQTSRAQTPFHLFAIHSTAPINAQAWKKRNQLLIGAAKQIAKAPMQHKILVGDMNITSYSKWFQKLINLSGLQNNQNQPLMKPSWSPLDNQPIWASLRIDHLLTSPSVQVLEQHIGNDFGSDHLPIITRLQLTNDGLSTR